MKKLAVVAALGLMAWMPLSGQAATVTPSPTFAVTLTLMPICTAAAVSDLSATYTAFDAAFGPSTGGGISLKCSTSLAYTFSLDGSSGTPTARQYTDATTGFAYTLSVPAGGTGNGASQTFSVLPTLTSVGAFSCSDSTSGCTVTASRTLTITY